MSQVQTGSRVSIHYIGTLENGRIFHSTPDHEPLAFTMGTGEVFPALEEAIIGMKVGEARNVSIPAAEAYGPRTAENVIRLARAALPAGDEPAVGRRLSVEFAGKDARVMVVTGVTDTEVTLDGNHPLAGLDLTFALKVVAID